MIETGLDIGRHGRAIRRDGGYSSNGRPPTASRNVNIVRNLQLKTNLDSSGHGVLQLAVMAFLRDSVPTLAVLEDVRLAIDEILLHDAITHDATVVIDIRLDADSTTIEIEIDVADIDIGVAHVEPLVDQVSVEHTPSSTRAIISRSWNNS